MAYINVFFLFSGVISNTLQVVWIFAGLTCIMVLCSGATLCFDEPAMVDYPPPVV